MVEVTDLFQNITTFNTEINLAFLLLFFTTVIVIYSLFVYYFYRFLAKKNILELNLSQYNQYGSPALAKFVAVVFYFLEYLFLLPILTFFWFAILSVLILFLAEGIPTGTILLITAAFVASVRVTSYFNERISVELAKIVPITFLAIAITDLGFFNVAKLLSKFHDVPLLFNDIIYFLLFIAAVEVIMRVAEFVYRLFNNENIEESDSEKEE
ncbi:MAG: hypothetical protein WC548_01685 [Candidatus Pacearchaeota archaeon]